eukprot:COSAG01_NODE_13603_length_1560_cov_2.313484_1_plen_361_part_01
MKATPADAAVSCGAGTSYVPATGSCTADCSATATATGHVYLAGIFELASNTSFVNYIKHHFTLAVDLINNHTDGVWDDVLMDAQIKLNTADSHCSEQHGAPAYLAMREWGKPLHGVIGAGCSGASIAVASVAQLDHMPQISFAATSPRLSNKQHFPFFYRTVTPDGPKGGAGAIVQLMRAFGWERVMVLRTSKTWAHDTAAQFSRLWVGEHSANAHDPTWTGQIPFSRTIEFGSDGSLDMASVAQAFAAMPVDNPSLNSRVIFLSVHTDDAWKILKHAAEIDFQKDAVFVGLGTFPGVSVPADFTSIPDIPGYIGLVPFENSAPENAMYLRHLQQYEAAHSLPMSTSISKYGAETVDAVVA